MSKYISAEEAVKKIKSGDHVYIHTAAATPLALVNAMTNRSDELKGVQIFHLHTEGEANYTKPEFRE
ncbi:MAG: acyl-CoA hydrolase, partial [Roseivirga sp.]